MPSLLSTLVDALEFRVVPAPIREDPAERRTARRLLYMATSLVPVYLFFAVYLHRSYGITTMSGASLTAALAEAVSLLVLWRTGATRAAGNLAVFGVWFQLMGMAGGAGTIAMPALLLLPLVAPLAILLCGGRTGWAWALLSLVGIGGLGALQLAGILVPQALPERKLLVGELMSQGLGIVYATALVSLFERQKLRALRDLEEERAHFAELATTDHLTGLPNRACFHQRLHEGMARRRRRGSRLGLLYLDLNGFKEINDVHGHQAGDAVLCELAKRFEGLVRAGDTLARLGGDEFAVLLENLESRAGARRLALRMRRLARRPIRFEEHWLSVDCSVGVALAPDDAQDEEGLVKAADSAMYCEKRSSSPV